MAIISGIVLGSRFLLEVITVLGLLSGAFIQKNLVGKAFFFLVGIAIVVLWSRYGAPKSPYVFTGKNKLALEIAVFSVGIIGFFSLFDAKIAGTYTVFVIVDLLLMYALHLQGN